MGQGGIIIFSRWGRSKKKGRRCIGGENWHFECIGDRECVCERVYIIIHLSFFCVNYEYLVLSFRCLCFLFLFLFVSVWSAYLSRISRVGGSRVGGRYCVFYECWCILFFSFLFCR